MTCQPGQHSEGFMLLKPFLNSLCWETGYIILLKDATAIEEDLLWKGYYLVLSLEWWSSVPCWILLNLSLCLTHYIASIDLFCFSKFLYHSFTRIMAFTYPVIYYLSWCNVFFVRNDFIQILDKVSWERYESNYSPFSYEWIIGQNGILNFSMATSPGRKTLNWNPF